MAAPSAAQIFIEPAIGYQIDLNNTQYSLNQINTSVQLSFKKGNRYEFILLLQKGWPVASSSNDSSFSLNPSLPVYANAQKKISPSAVAFSIGNRFIVAGIRSKDMLSILFNAGIMYQKIKVSYQYDKGNYTILNPDQTQKVTGIFVCGGLEYMRLLKKGRLFFQATVASPPSGKTPPYSSFNFIAPLSFNVGYSILVKKQRHAKK